MIHSVRLALAMSISHSFFLECQDVFGFDAPPRRLLYRMAPTSSARDSASSLRDGGPCAAAGSYVLFIASIIILAFIVAAVGGRGLNLARRL